MQRVLKGFKKRVIRGVKCYRQILRDPTISDGELRLLLLMKSKAKNGICDFEHHEMAEEMGWERKKVQRLSASLEKKRLIKTIPQSSRGLKIANRYSMDDEFYARHLAKKKKPARCPKNGTGVPIGTSNIPVVSLCEDSKPAKIYPSNIIRYEPAKKPRKKA